jgi:hypothetical protein
MTGPKPVPHPDDVIVGREISEVGSRVRCCKSRRTLKTRFVVSGSSLNVTSGKSRAGLKRSHMTRIRWSFEIV